MEEINTDLRYSEAGDEIYQDLTGKNYSFKMSGHIRSVNIHLNVDDNEITVNIDNEGPVDEDEDQAVEYSFSLEQWLDRKGISPIKYPFRLNSYEGTLQAQMQQFFAFLDQALQDDTLQKILRGETWDYVSFDWGDMK